MKQYRALLSAKVYKEGFIEAENKEDAEERIENEWDLTTDFEDTDILPQDHYIWSIEKIEEQKNN